MRLIPILPLGRHMFITAIEPDVLLGLVATVKTEEAHTQSIIRLCRTTEL